LGLASAALIAESRIEKTLKIDAGGRLEVDTERGAVTVTGGPGKDVHVVVTARNRELEDLLTLRFEENGRNVRIVGRKKGGHLFDWSDGGRVRFEIEVPLATPLEIDTSGGAISIASIHGEIRLHTSGGGIEVRDVVGDVDGNTSGGGVR